MVMRTLMRCVLLCWCFWFCVSAAFQASDGQEPWLVVWKKGVDGQVLWNTLCPTMTTGDQSPAALSGRSSDDNLDSRDASRSLKAKMPRELVLNCSVRFSHLFSGFAGRLTLKELDAIKAQYKHSIEFVISDRAIQVDEPSGLLHMQQPDDVGPVAQSATPVAPSRPGMSMEFSSGTSHRQLLFTPPPSPLWALGPKRRMLPEENNVTWGLDIIDQGQQPFDTVYRYTYNGTGVHVYILDTGIRTTHQEFIDPDTKLSRAVHGFDAVYGTNSSEDCHGHGTHVAAVVGGNTFGVAKNVTLHAVRVLACDGTAMVSALLKGLEWVAKNHIKPAVVHMSIEGGFSSVVNQAVEQLVKIYHLHVVVSSGNNGKDACLASPASAPSAITVAAIDDKLARWSYANWGACVDVFAPGVAILSAVSNKGDAGTALKTGTSMAAPFVTGVVATYLEAHPGASADEVQQKLYQTALRGSVADDVQGFATMYPSDYPDLLDISSTPNRLLHANLTSQAVLSPGNLHVNDTVKAPLEFSIILSQQPSDNVTVDVSVPAAWDGSPLADLAPAQLLFTPDTWNQQQIVSLRPRQLCDGDYYIKLNLQGQGVDGYPGLHTVLVHDTRRRSGENAAMARVISKLPFNDTGDTTGFNDNYGCQATDASPDVVYSFTPSLTTDVTISTCGSGFDTKLLVSTNLSDPGTYMCNDDDRACTANTACSRLDVSFKAGTSYFIVVDGYSRASGEYTLSVTCNPRCPTAEQQQQQVAGDGDSNTGSASVVGGETPSSPRTSTMLIQALLHLSRNPAPSNTTTVNGASPSPSPSPAPPASAAPASPTPQTAPAVVVPGPMVAPFRARPGGGAAAPQRPAARSPATPASAPGSRSAGGGGGLGQQNQQMEGHTAVQGPIAALLASANNGSSGAAAGQQLQGAPPARTGPLSLIQRSSWEDAENQTASNVVDNTPTVSNLENTTLTAAELGVTTNNSTGPQLGNADIEGSAQNNNNTQDSSTTTQAGHSNPGRRHLANKNDFAADASQQNVAHAGADTGRDQETGWDIAQAELVSMTLTSEQELPYQPTADEEP